MANRYKQARKTTESRKIDFTVSMLYFSEPAGHQRVYADYIGNYFTLTLSPRPGYRAMPADREDESVYEKGRLVRVIKKMSMTTRLPATTALLILLVSSLSWAQPAVPATAITTDVLHFCGEQLPGYLPTVTQRWLKTLGRRARYIGDLVEIQRKAAVLFPIIEPILEQHALPQDLKYLALVESELNGRSLSRRGAAGLWQLMPQTARALGLTVSTRNDQRYDVRKATQAACRYLGNLHRQTGSWMLAASAYNAGPTYIAQLTKQFSADHSLLLPFAKVETQVYVYQALAYKELLTRPKFYPDLLSQKAIDALTRPAADLSLADRQAILAVIETPQPETDQENVPSELTAFALTDSGNDAATVLLEETIETGPLTNTRPVTKAAAPQSVSESASCLCPSVHTRSLTNDALTEGQLFVFEVIRPQTIGGVSLAVGDMVYAHVEIIDPSAGRVYLLADHMMSAQTRETRPLKLVAVEKDHKPGVPLPVRDGLASGWQLSWEKL